MLTNQSLASRLGRAVNDFVARPASPRPLAALRIGVAAVLLLQAVACVHDLTQLYGSLGTVQRPVVEAVLPLHVPRLGWVIDTLGPCGVSEGTCIRGVFLVYVAALMALLLGWRTPGAAVCAWLSHLALKASSVFTSYGVDEFAHIALFYCIWMPVGHAWSVDVGAGRASSAPSAAARLSLRVWQVHLCIVYLSSGLLKATGSQWWNGEAIWRVLMRSDLNPWQYDFAWLASAPWLTRLACWSTLAVEVGYAFLVWPRRTRKIGALAAISLHLGIAVLMGLWSFSALMIVFTASVFLVSAESGASSEVSARGSAPGPSRRCGRCPRIAGVSAGAAAVCALPSSR
jgi:hypothetical protein